MPTSRDYTEQGRGQLAPLAIVTTSPYQVALFLLEHVDALPAALPVTVFTNMEDEYARLLAKVEKLDVRPIPITRSARLTSDDARAAHALWTAFRSGGIETVLTVSPKAGFLGHAAARAARVEKGIHIFTGQVWDGAPPGCRRQAALQADRAIARMATHLAADSTSQAERLMKTRVAPVRKPVHVPNPAGSIRGVDVNRFKPDEQTRKSFRAVHGIAQDAMCFVQLGRITGDKGVHELASAFAQARMNFQEAHMTSTPPTLLLVGSDEDGIAEQLAQVDGVHVIGFTDQPEHALMASDVMVLASHREGFPLSIIEGAACGLPTIGTNIVGTRDAVTNATGWLVEPRKISGLAAALTHALENETEVRAKGAAALDRAQRDFDSKRVSRNYADFIMEVHTR